MNYLKGYMRMGLGIAAVLAIGVLSYYGGTIYVDAGFPLREGAPTTWWAFTGIGFAIIVLGVVVAVGCCFFGILLVRGIHWLAGFIGGIGDKKEKTL